MTIRTQAQALAEAVRRWGKTAAVRKSTCWRGDPAKAAAGDRDHKFYLKHCSGQHHPHDCPGGKPLFTIGRVELGLFFSVKAAGTSWAHAFAVADWNGHDDRARCLRRPCCDWGKDRVL